MNGYEIRILNIEGLAAIKSAASYYNDDAAITLRPEVSEGPPVRSLARA